MGDLKKQKTKKASEGPDGSGWEIVYTGFILILLCFFIMLSSFSTMEEAKIMRFVKSFSNAVGIMSGGLKFDPGPVVLPKSADIVDSEDKLAQLFSELSELNEHLGKEISLAHSTEGLVMRLSDRALFDVGVATISPQAVPLLQKVADIIARTNFEVRIEGHSDNLPIKTAQFPSNWELSTARAVNVLRFFLDTDRISSRRLSAVGFGEHQPVVPNDSIDHRAQNRRVEIIFLPSDQKPDQVEGVP
jgi:chemotaxis protein MotB